MDYNIVNIAIERIRRRSLQGQAGLMGPEPDWNVGKSFSF